MRLPRLAEVTVGDLGRGAVRLSPFIGAAGAALLMVALPPHERAASHATASSHRYTIPTPPGLEDASQSASAPSPPTTSDTVNLVGASAPSPSLELTGTTTGAAFFAPAATTEDAPPPGGFTMPGDQAVTAEAHDEPLKIVAHGWASREAGTPLANEGVPDGTLPVGNRASQIDKASYIKLSGNALFLTLTEDANGARNLAGTGGVQACEITASWTPGDAISFDNAPAYDTKGCAQGKRSDDGTWKFDMGNFDDRGSGNGFALIPTTDAPVDFQVAFKLS